ncbi:PAS domain-containing protein (plasmid) [Deinococcus taeanensis]|uniref:PAS domain-containing sensor histidine kinase n=1 Tax=Deinococcus taeanensis TaxID=2737050 RepID=UPI001CDBB59E|nr:PAS domain-containing protein [Deinococcus taeanensis]UBV44657.1 PAS domain-containing protein [Deinococcus taeanensis]
MDPHITSDPVIGDAAALMDELPQIVWVGRADGWPLTFNRQWFEYTGLTPEQTRGRGWEAGLHPDDLPRYLAARQAAVRTGVAYAIESRFRRGADGSYRWHLGRAKPLRDEAGQIVRWMGTCTDIHDQKEGQAEAAERERHFRSLVANVPGVVYRCALDANWTMSFISDSIQDLCGYPAEEFTHSVGRTFASIIHPDDVQAVDQTINGAVGRGVSYDLEYRVVHKNGEVRWVHERGRAITTGTGEVAWLDGVVVDITGRHQAEQERLALLEQVRAERTLLTDMLEQMPSAVWLAEAPSGKLLLGNRGIEHLWGHSFQPATGIDDYAGYSGLHPDGRAVEPHEWPLARAIEQGEVVTEQEIDVVRPDGTLRRAAFSAAPIHNAAGQRVAAVVTGTDISERKQAERAIRELNADLERRVEARTRNLVESQAALQTFARQLELSNRELQDFASVASHDLQEPLRKIQAFADRLKTRHAPALGDEGRDYLERMQAAASRMQRLINDLLSLSRVTTQAKPFVPVDLQEVVRDVLLDLDVRIETLGGQVQVQSLPVVAGDPTQLRQLMQNLIGNALKFHGARPPVVQVRAAPDDQGWQLNIQDNGVGFDEKYLDRIFSPFQRLHGRNVFEGTGIGLTICRKIVERHDGTITATSVPDQGSTFVVRLPHAEVPKPEELYEP